ncbi:glycosyltransferase [Pedobacter sp.]|uniref:glycosyltransferase n=1 Tax=Pedobacter sp. TaxID=1411316 RepID=UPI003D7F5815
MKNNDRPINIVYIAVCDGGSFKALLNMLDGLAAYHVNPLVIINVKNEFTEELERRNIPYQVVRYKFNLWPFYSSWNDKIRFFWRLFSNPVYNLIALKRMEGFAKNFGAELVHTNTGVLHVGFKVAKKLGLPHVWHFREYQNTGVNVEYHFHMHPFPTIKCFFSKLYFPENYSIAITEGIYRHFNMHSDRARIIYDGVFKSTNGNFVADKSRYFLFVGRINHQKGFTDLIDAFVDFAAKDQDYELWIAAKFVDNEYTKAIQNKLHQKNLQARVKFLGYRADVQDFMLRATALIVPSKFEGFGFITAEAMFNGCLVIGRNVTGTKEQFDNGLKENGLEIGLRFSSTTELSRALNEVKSNGIASYVPMIRRAQKTAIRLYAIEENSRKVFEYYQDLLNQRIPK